MRQTSNFKQSQHKPHANPTTIGFFDKRLDAPSLLPYIIIHTKVLGVNGRLGISMRYSNCTAVDVRMDESSFDQFLTLSNPPRCMSEPRRGGADGDADSEGGLMVAEPLAKTKRPPMYKVILLNDDYTPMDFVVMVLEQIFQIPHTGALNVMLEVHQKGAGLAGVYTRDVAETKVDQVIEYARINDYPLQCTLEQE